MRFAIVAALGFASLAAGLDMSQAQTTDKRGPLSPREKYREQMNENVLYLMGGQLGAAYVVIAHDISVVVNEGDSLRVLPVIGGAAVQNLRDVVFLRGIDPGSQTC